MKLSEFYCSPVSSQALLCLHLAFFMDEGSESVKELVPPFKTSARQIDDKIRALRSRVFDVPYAPDSGA
jgi:hypothetical protein